MSSARDVIVGRILESLANGVVPWKKPWDVTTGAPANYVTGKPYNGMNILLCLCSQYSNPYFLTFNQIRDLGGKLKKGSKGTPICFYKSYEDKNDPDKKSFVLRYSTVFRWEDTEGIPEKGITKVEREFSPVEEAERLWVEYPGAPKLEIVGQVACYSPSRDVIKMPHPEAFHSPEAYYSTLFHEMTHSTGHASRLAREEVGTETFGTVGYSREELVAEIGATFLCSQAGILTDESLSQSAAYIENWSRFLKEDPNAILTAASKASRSVDHILGLDIEQEEEGEEAEAA